MRSNFQKPTDSILHALERQGCLEASEALENGRIRRYYRLTESGQALLAAEKRAWREFMEAVNRNLEARARPG